MLKHFTKVAKWPITILTVSLFLILPAQIEARLGGTASDQKLKVSITENPCQCSNLYMPKSSCARAYLDESCNICKNISTYYTDLKGINAFVPEEFMNRSISVIVRRGCSLTVFDEEDFEGNSKILEGLVESWYPGQKILSYECSCSNNANYTFPKKPDNSPRLINVPENVDKINNLINGKTGRHPALLAALQSIKHKRSSRNAYILALGTCGSSKSNTIDSIFDASICKEESLNFCGSAGIDEYRIPLPVKELGLANSELRVIDTPGLGMHNSLGVGMDAKNLATLDDFLSNHEELKENLPNVVLIFHRFTGDARGSTATFQDMLHALDPILPRITDNEYSNVIFVFTHFMDNTRQSQRRPGATFALFKSAIENYSHFPKPINMAVAEHRFAGMHTDLPSINSYYRLQNKEYYPQNIIKKIHQLTSNGHDPIGEGIITTAFRDSSNFTIAMNNTRVTGSENPKIPKYRSIVEDTLYKTVAEFQNTEVSERLANASETMDYYLRFRFPNSLWYLRNAFSSRNISTLAELPSTDEGKVQLLRDLKQNDATQYLLLKAFSLKQPAFSTKYPHPIPGRSFHAFNYEFLPDSPVNLSVTKDSDIGYAFPEAMECVVKREQRTLFKVFSNKTDYFNYRLRKVSDSSTALSGRGINVDPIGIKQQTSNWTLTVVHELLNFELTLNSKPNLSPKFIDTLKDLTPLNMSDSESVANWTSFFNEYGTHVFQSVQGGGRIEVTVTSNAMWFAIEKALKNLVELAEDLFVGKPMSNTTFTNLNYEYTFRFFGGNTPGPIVLTDEFIRNDATDLIQDWKESLNYKPILFDSEIRLLPLSELVKQSSMSRYNISAEIERSVQLLFNTTLPFEPKPNIIFPPPPRDEIYLKTNVSTSNFQKALEDAWSDYGKADAEILVSMLEEDMRSIFEHLDNSTLADLEIRSRG